MSDVVGVLIGVPVLVGFVYWMFWARRREREREEAPDFKGWWSNR